MIFRDSNRTPTESALVRAATVHDPADDHWQFDEAVYGERPPCSDAKAFELGCNVDYGVDGKPVPFEDGPAFTEFCTFNLVHSEKCSILANETWKDVRARAERNLQIKERKALEATVWGAENAPIGIACAFTDETGPTATILNSGSDFASINAVTALENVIYELTDVAYIHVPRVLVNYVIPFLDKDDAGNFRTALGSYVIPGVGYDGSGPGGEPDETGDSGYIYGTGEIQLIRGTVLSIPEDPAQARDPGKNTVEFIAERAWGVWVDPCVGVYGVSAKYCHVS